jgi:hypothetical protein
MDDIVWNDNRICAAKVGFFLGKYFGFLGKYLAKIPPFVREFQVVCPRTPYI